MAALLDPAPFVVLVKDADESEGKVPVDVVAVGARFLVRTGDRIPLDGTVASGSGTVNQAHTLICPKPVRLVIHTCGSTR